MAARTYVVDSGGTSHIVKKLFVVDSSNTTRQVKRCFVIDSGNTARLVYVAAQVIPATISNGATSPASATSNISFTTAGQEIATGNSSPVGTVLGNWLPGGNTSGYQIMATLSSGTAPQQGGATNTLNVWLPVTANLSWGLERTTAGSFACSLLFQISDNHGASVLAAGTVNLSVMVSPSG